MSGEGRRKREREKKRDEEEGGSEGMGEMYRGDPHYGENAPGYLAYPWETDRRRRKRVSPEEDEGLARRSCLLDPPQRIPCSVFSLSLSLSSLGRIRKESQLPSCKTATPRNKTRDIIIIGEVDPVAVNLSEEEGSLRYCCSSRK